MRRTSLLAALTAAAMTLGLAVVAQPARAAVDVAVDLPLDTFDDLVLDVAHGRLFLLGDNGEILARDLAGAAVGTAYVAGQEGLALSPDGTRLYVSNAQTDAIVAYDPTTLTPLATYATGASTCPKSLAAVGSVVWFAYGCTSGRIGLLDLSGEAPVVTLDKAPAEAGELRVGFPKIEVTPDGSRLLAAVTGLYQETLYSFAVADGALTLAASRVLGESLRDFAVTPDGAKVVTASDSPHHHARYLVADLAEDGVLGADLPTPVAAGVTDTLVAAGTSAPNGDDLRVYRADGTLLRRYELGRTPVPGGLVFAPDGSTLYAVSHWPVRLHVLRDPTKPPAGLSLTAPASRRVGTPFTLTGALGGPGEGKTLKVTRSSQYGTVALPDVTTGADGAFSFSDTVAKRGGYTYTVTFEGDESYAAASKGVAFGVAGLVPSLSITTDKPRYAFRAAAVVTARLTTWSSRKRLTIQAQTRDMGNQTLRSADADANGYLAVRYTITRRTAFVVSYGGDDVYEPRTVSIARDAYAGLTTTLHGYYATSGGYRLYRRTVHPSIYVRVLPERYGACLLFEAQVYRSGAWRPLTTNTCLRTSYGGEVYAALYGTHPVNVPHRIRATFQGDVRNLRTVGPWVYLKFTY